MPDITDTEMIERFHSWRKGANKKVKDYYMKNYPDQYKGEIEFKINRKWIKTWHGGSLYVWIDRVTGEIISGSWKIPGPKWGTVAHPNLQDEDYGVSGVSVYGQLYQEQWKRVLAERAKNVA